MPDPKLTLHPQKSLPEIKLSRAVLETLIAAVTEAAENIPTYNHAEEPDTYWVTYDDLEAMRHIIDGYSPDADARLLHLDWIGKVLRKARSERPQ